jgi:hypothetical protein
MDWEVLDKLMPKKYMKQYLYSSGMLYCIILQKNKGIVYTTVDVWSHSSLWYQQKNLESQNETSDHNKKGYAANLTTLLKQQ